MWEFGNQRNIFPMREVDLKINLVKMQYFDLQNYFDECVHLIILFSEYKYKLCLFLFILLSFRYVSFQIVKRHLSE